MIQSEHGGLQADKEHKKTAELFSVHEGKNGNFKAVLIDLTHFENPYPLVVTAGFASEEEAQHAAAENQKLYQEYSEYRQLVNRFSPIKGIRRESAGQYTVYSPAGTMADTGWRVGRSETTYTSWQEARNAFLEQEKKFEKLSDNPIVQFSVEGVDFSLTNLSSLDQKIVPAAESIDPPQIVKDVLLPEVAMNASHSSAETYQRTIEKEDWDKELFQFVEDTLKKNAAYVQKELGIESLRSLTPKQAIELSIRLVIDFTKYEGVDTARPENADHVNTSSKSEADSMTALQLLQTSMEQKKNPEWNGLGECRNYASTVKAVFEALKSNQQRMNQLRNTYCLYESDFEGGAYNPKRKQDAFTAINLNGKIGHAWNTFVTITPSKAEAVSVDATWGKRDLDTGEIVGADHTLLRMEPTMNRLLEKMPLTDTDVSDPKQADNFSNGLLYYAITSHMLRSAEHAPKAWREYMESRALPHVAKAVEASVPIPRSLVNAVMETMKEASFYSMKECETLYGLLLKTGEEREIATFIDKYIQGHQSEDWSSYFVSENPKLQKLIFVRLKAEDPKSFTREMERNIKFRIRVREVAPAYLGDALFSPGENSVDRKECEVLLEMSSVGRSLLSMYERKLRNGTFSTDDFNSVTNQLYTSLRAMNETAFDALTKRMSDWDILRNATKIEKQLRQKS